MHLQVQYAPLFSICLILSGCGSSTTQVKYDSPQAAYDAFSNASQAGEWRTLAEALTPESQDALAAMLLLPAGMAAAFDESAGGELELILKKHELSSDTLDVGADELPVKDKPAFIADVAEWLMRQGGDSSDLGMPSGKLTDLAIDGDSATGTIKDEPISFRQVDGGWLVHLETPASELDDVTLSTDTMQGEIGGVPWTVKSVVKGPFGGFKLLAEDETEASGFPDGPQIMMGEAWESLQSGSGRLSGSRNITFFVPPGSNTICMTGKYEITEADNHWVLHLYASEGDDTFVNGKAIIPKSLVNQ